ncbi:MAG: endonuclease/exonuclease/phosphatase family protein [Armatimonadetes bacterium]|nr:endonuclease/exonuclease/phosphatase family protein [Armatimonadota bacterium]
MRTAAFRLATWNIRAGGGRRIEGIAEVIKGERPDLLVLTEYRPLPGKRLTDLLDGCGYHVVEGSQQGTDNSVCILSKSPMVVHRSRTRPTYGHRWVAVKLPERDLVVLGVHVPNQTEIWNKREFWHCIQGFSRIHGCRRAIIMGDLNTALDEDCQGDPIREAVHLKWLLNNGWVDAWRSQNELANEYSWFSHRANGFRLDHCFLSRKLSGSLVSAQMRHDVRERGLSDHSWLTVDLKRSPHAPSILLDPTLRVALGTSRASSVSTLD